MDLCLRLENHWLACMATAGGGRVTRLSGGLVVASPTVPGMSFNFMVLRGVAPERLAPVLEMGGALLAGAGRPPAVFLSPAAGDMDALGAALAQLGWRCVLQQIVLVRDLPATAELPPAASVAVTTVGPSDLPIWGQTLAEAYEVDPITGEELSGAWTGLLAHPGDGCWARGYLAWVGGQPVGTGLTWSQGEIAGLYCGAVLPAYRRRGAERATLTARLADAAAAGCRTATLQTEAGSPVEHLCLSRLGFARAHARTLWTPYTQRLSGQCE